MIKKLRNMTSIYILRNDEILLLYRQGGRVVNNVWTGSAGGHFEENELNDPEACVLRELKEELGIDRDDISNLKLRYITLRRTKEELRQNYYYFAELNESFSKTIVSNEGTSQWFPLEEISTLDMPYTAKYVVAHYLKAGRYSSETYAGVADGEEVKFIILRKAMY